MELLERYLHAVRFWLPRKQQQDIIAELGDDLRSQIEDKESALGRPLNEDEMVALLRQAGNPMWVAARYQRQTYLIGPALFPLYKFVLMIVGLGYLVPWFMVWLARVIFLSAHRAESPVLTAIAGWSAMWHVVLLIFGIVTLLFAVLERFHASLTVLQKWDPRKLPKVPQEKNRVSRVESAFGLVFSIAFLVWWLSLPRYGSMLFGPLGGTLFLNPVLRGYFLPALAPMLLLIAQQGINLFRPQWTWLRAASLLVADAISLGIVVSLLRLSNYVVLAEAAKNVAKLVHAVTITNQVILWSLIGSAVGISIVLAVHAYQTVREVRRLNKAGGTPAAMRISQLL